MSYPEITIIDETYAVKIRKNANKITNKLAVAYGNPYPDNRLKIYSIQAHREAIPHNIATYEDAVKIAQFLDAVYGEYWDIHDHPDWHQANIPQLVMYTIPNGIRTFEALKSLERKDTITYSDLEQALKNK